MKIRLLSDLHMEGFKYCYVPAGEDLVILAGDIHTRNRHDELIDQIPATTQILMVAGNHEYYRGEFHDVNRYLKSLEDKYSNFKLLHNPSTEIDGVSFFGGTMFSDLLLYGYAEEWACREAAQMGVNDFRVSQIEDGGFIRTWTVVDHIAEHQKFKDNLMHWVRESEGKKRVAISHFVPHARAIHARWGRSSLNAYFTSDMTRYMGWEGLWLFGHTHDSCDFMVGDTHCISNPKGYGDENCGGFNEERLIEI